MRVATWSLAASLFAAVGGLLLFGGSHGLALADVRKAAEKHKVVKYKMTTTLELKGVTSDAPPVEMVVYADLNAPRFRLEQPKQLRLYKTVEVFGYHVQDFTNDRWLGVYSNVATDAAKDPNLDENTRVTLRSLKLPMVGATLQTLSGAQGLARRKNLLDELRDLESSKDATATDARVGETPAVKYTLTIDKATTSLWVAKATKLPVRLESEAVGTDPATKRVHTVQTDFKWDPELTGFKDIDALFDLTPPPGFVLTDMTKDKR